MISALTDGKKRNKTSIVNSLVFELLDQNKTLQKQIIELSKERNIIVNNTNNNQFNLNFFLNEQCKDAVNLSDFVNSLEITMDDLTYTRNQGLVEGISKVMIDGLKQMDMYKRMGNITKAQKKITKEEIDQVEERSLTEPEMEKKEEIVKSMKKGLSGFKARYGDRAKEVMYATATKQAKK
jgi:hypothetical protein